MIHELKTWPIPFEAVTNGTKTHELRKADRPFAPGDVLYLREWVPPTWARNLNGPPSGYTGREQYVRVTYVTRAGEWGLPEELCCLSVRLMSEYEVDLLLLLARAVKA